MTISKEQMQVLQQAYESWRQHPMTTEIFKMLDMRREKYVRDAVVASNSYNLPAEATRGAVHAVATVEALKALMSDFNLMMKFVTEYKQQN